MIELKRTYSIKLAPTPDQTILLQNLFNEYGNAIHTLINHIQHIHNQHPDLPEQLKKTCYNCNTEKTCHKQHKQSQQTICDLCFSRLWSWQTLTLASEKGYLQTLIQTHPTLSKHRGYYAGVIKYGVQMYKSYHSKQNDRKKELNQLETAIKSCTNPKTQQILLEKYKQKSKGIKPLEFRKNVIYLGNAGMFDIKQENTEYYIGICNPLQLRDKIWFNARIGKIESYKTSHNKHELLQTMLKTNEHKQYFGKILRITDPLTHQIRYEFMFPKRDRSTSETEKPAIHKFYTDNPNTSIISISFGIKKPITITAHQNKKLIGTHIFGNGSLWNYTIHKRFWRKKIVKTLSKRYNKSKWNKKKHLKTLWKKHAGHEREKIKYLIHNLTTQCIKHIAAHYPQSIIVYQDLVGIKRINYPGMYRTILSAWNVEMQKSMMEYKHLLQNNHLYSIPYKTLSVLTCAKCESKILNLQTEEDSKENRAPKEIKTLTLKLLHASNTKTILINKKQSLEAKFYKLTKISHKDKLMWIQKVGDELKRVKTAINNINNKPLHHRITCPKGHTQDFYVNECLRLHSTFHREWEASSSPKGQDDAGLTSIPPMSPGL